MKRVSVVWELVFAALAISAAVPVWLVKHPPIQDLPQHLAAIRVLHDHGNPAFGFEQYFNIHVGRTQYLTYYVLTHLLAYPLGLLTANKVVFTAAIVGLPYSLRALLGSLGRDQRLALFAMPLAWNAHIVLGFVNFAAAIPLALWGISLAVGLRFRWDVRQALVLAGVAMLTFYTHIVPFGFLGLGVVLTALGNDTRAMGRRLLPLVPAIVGLLGWARSSPAAKTVLGASELGAATSGTEPEYHPFSRSMKDAGLWLFDVLQSEVDDQLLVVWTLLLVVTLALGAGAASSDDRPSEDDLLRGRLVRRLALLAPLAFVAYFIAPSSYDWIWPINARFLLIGVMFLLVALPSPRRGFGLPIFAGAALVSAFFFREVGMAFQQCQREELADVDAAVNSIPMGQRVVGLVWDRDSRFVKWSPYLHAAAMVQVERGGAAMFSFAEYPQSPFSFKAGNRPPKVPRRWEWAPFFTRPVPDLDWYEYVITRGDPGTIKLYPEAFELHYDGQRWKVWKRRDPKLAFEGGEAAYRFLTEGQAVKPEADSSCATFAKSVKEGTVQAAVREVVLRAEGRKGRCGAVESGARRCTLELRNDPSKKDGFDFSVEFELRDGAITASSVRCSGVLPQPPM